MAEVRPAAASPPVSVDLPQLRAQDGRRLRVAHLTTVDMSLALLLPVELSCDVAAGLEVTGYSAPGPYVERVADLGVEHVPIRSLTREWRPAADLRAAVELWRGLRRLRPDVLHTHNPKTGVLGRIVGRAAGVPVVVNTCHGLWADRGDSPVKRALVYGAESFAAWFSDAELFQNSADRATLRRWTPRRRARVVGNGTDLAVFQADPVARRRVRVELGVATDELLVGGAGRLVAEKGIREFVAAARALERRARFVWAGPVEPADPESEALVALLEKSTAVRLLGERVDMAGFYNALDIFVLPTYREGFSRSAMEAAACGKAMVLTDIRGCREIGVHGEHLLLVPSRDAEALTSAVELLLTDRALRERLGSHATQRATREFDQRVIALASLTTYAEVAERKKLGWRFEGSGGAPSR